MNYINKINSMNSKDNIKYEIIRSKRKTCAIQVYPNARVVVRTPKYMPNYLIKAFVDAKSNWIESKINSIKSKQNQAHNNYKISEAKLEQLKKNASQYIPERVEYYAPIVGVEYNNISIKLLKSRWGSCSSKKNLNFNCLLMLTSSEIIDYVVVHELCHIKQMNHSKLFWQEVKRVLPNYKESQNWLKQNERKIVESVFEY